MGLTRKPSKIQLKVLHKLLGPGCKVSVSHPGGSGENAYIRFPSPTKGGVYDHLAGLTTSTIESLHNRRWIKRAERVGLTYYTLAAPHTYVITDEGRKVADKNPILSREES